MHSLIVVAPACSVAKTVSTFSSLVLTVRDKLWHILEDLRILRRFDAVHVAWPVGKVDGTLEQQIGNDARLIWRQPLELFPQPATPFDLAVGAGKT